MASIGRGRGWAKVGETEAGTRRPGPTNVQKTSELDELVSKIYDLGIDATPHDHQNEVVNFVNSYKMALKDQNTENLDKLFQQALDDPCFAVKFIKFFKTEYILSRLQICYQRRKELRQDNPLHLTSLTWMLGILAGQATVKCEACVLGGALLNCLSLLLDIATEDDLECVAIQLYLHGKSVREYLGTDSPVEESSVETVGFLEILNKVRQILINRNVSVRSRALLLLIIDLERQHYEPLTGDLQIFYMKTLEPSQGLQSDSKFTDRREFNQQVFLYKLLSKGVELKKESKSKNEKVLSEKAEKLSKNETQREEQAQRIQNDGNPGPVPRAIRGAGASDASKDSKNQKKSYRPHREKLTDKQVWSAKQNTGSKVWGHDDRFDNDYE